MRVCPQNCYAHCLPFNFFIFLVIFHMVFTFEWVNVKTKLWNYCVILVEIFEISMESMILDIGWINVFHQLIKKICESISSQVFFPLKFSKESTIVKRNTSLIRIIFDGYAINKKTFLINYSNIWENLEDIVV